LHTAEEFPGAGVYLFEYDAERGTLRHKNALAKQAMEKALSAF